MGSKKIYVAMTVSVLFSLALTLLVPCFDVSAEEATAETAVESSETTTVQTEPATVPEDILTLTREAGYVVDDSYRPAATILIEANSGQIMWEDQIDQVWYPASIAKMMTVYLLFDAIKEGKLTLDTLVTATEADEAISQIYELSNTPIVAGVAYPVADLLYMTTLASSNAATVMLANLVSADDAAAFIKMMNAKAEKLGMNHTTFYNPSGAAASAFNGYYSPVGIDPEADNVSTARDLALMFYHLLKDHPNVLEYTKPFQVTVMEGTEYAAVLENSNKSIPGGLYGYEGTDGLKTGSTPEGAFSYAATAQQGELRLIEVVLGVGTWEDGEGENQRHVFGNALFDYGFASFDYKKLLTAGEQTINGEEVTVKQDFYGLLRKDSQPKFMLANEQLTLDNQLAQVSPSVPVPSVTYQVKETVKNHLAPESLSEAYKDVQSAWKEYLIAAIALILSLLTLFSAKKVDNRYRQTRSHNTAKKQFVFFIGVVLLFTAVAVAAVTFVFGPWLPF